MARLCPDTCSPSSAQLCVTPAPFCGRGPAAPSLAWMRDVVREAVRSCSSRPCPLSAHCLMLLGELCSPKRKGCRKELVQRELHPTSSEVLVSWTANLPLLRSSAPRWKAACRPCQPCSGHGQRGGKVLVETPLGRAAGRSRGGSARNAEHAVPGREQGLGAAWQGAGAGTRLLAVSPGALC